MITIEHIPICLFCFEWLYHGLCVYDVLSVSCASVETVKNHIAACKPNQTNALLPFL